MLISDWSSDVCSSDLYRREPARSLLMLSFEQGVSMAGLLRRHGLTNADLFAFMNAPEGRSDETKSRVRDVLDKLGISTARTEPFAAKGQEVQMKLEESCCPIQSSTPTCGIVKER